MSGFDGYVQLAVDGKWVTWGWNNSGDTRTGVKKWTPGFHLIEVMMTGQRVDDGRVYIGMSLCKTSDPSSCGSVVDINPVMTWPPVCGDAVKFKVDTSSADAVSYGTLGNTDKKPWI